MKKIIKHKFLLLCFMGLGMASKAQQIQINPTITPSEATELVTNELPNLLALISPDDMKQFGFNEDDQFENIHLGRPFYMSLLPNAASNDQVVCTPHTILVPLILNGYARCVVYVSPVQERWQPVGLGEAMMVQNSARIFNNEDAISYSLVQVPQANQIFYMHDNQFSPIFHFEGEQQNDLNLKQLKAFNNAPVIDAEGLPTSMPASDQNDSNQNNK